MQWFEEEVSRLETARAAQNFSSAPVVFYGSSSIRLWDTLAADLADPRALNQGFGGSTLEACAYFFERLVAPLRPSSLVLYAGDNDLGDGQNPEQVLSSFRALIAKMDQALPQVAFTYMSIKPSPARSAIVKEIWETNRLIRAEVETRGNCALFLNIFDAMLDSQCRPRSDLFGEDGLHLNRDGYRLWTELLSPFRHRIFVETYTQVQS